MLCLILKFKEKKLIQHQHNMEQTNINQPDSQGSQNNQGNILRELSDIKTSIGINTEATNNMKENISEIKVDLKEIKNNAVTQEQHLVLSKCIDDHENRIRLNDTSITRIMTWGAALLLLLGIIEVTLRFIIK